MEDHDLHIPRKKPRLEGDLPEEEKKNEKNKKEQGKAKAGGHHQNHHHNNNTATASTSASPTAAAAAASTTTKKTTTAHTHTHSTTTNHHHHHHLLHHNHNNTLHPPHPTQSNMPSTGSNDTVAQIDGPTDTSAQTHALHNPSSSHQENTTLPSPSPSASPPSSSAASVEIDVADVEDMSQDPTTSRWRPLKSNTAATTTAAAAAPAPAIPSRDSNRDRDCDRNIDLLAAFPKVRPQYSVQESILELCRMLECGSSHDLPAFLLLKAWLAKCAACLPHITRERFRRERTLWENLPLVAEALMRRPSELLPGGGENGGSGIGIAECLEEWLTLFAGLALHFVRVDVQTLKEANARVKGGGNTDGVEPVLTCTKYLPPLCWMLQLTGIPFYQALLTVREADIVNVVTRLNDKLAQAPYCALTDITEFTTLLFPLLPRFTNSLLQSFLSCCLVVNNFIDSAIERESYEADAAYRASPVLFETLEACYVFVRSMDVAYQSYVSKKYHFISSECAETLYRNISNAYEVCAKYMPGLAKRMARDLEIKIPPGTEPDSLPFVIRLGWELKMLTKLIKEGRMELRVYGIETMQHELVLLFKRYPSDDELERLSKTNSPEELQEQERQRKKQENERDSALRLAVHSLRESKLLEYIVGVDSHEQIIGRGVNVVGFLIHTGSYTNADTDIIWRTITDSQDARIMVDVLKMLTKTFSFHRPWSNALQYMCTLLLELPLARFDGPMMEYCDVLLATIREKIAKRADPKANEDSTAFFIDFGPGSENGTGRSDDADEADDFIPFQLCVHLIREAPTVPELPTEQKAVLQSFAAKQLSSLLCMGVREDLKAQIFKQCIQDLTEANEHTVGSVQALDALTRPGNTDDLQRLTYEFGLTELLVKNIAQMCVVEGGNGSGSESRRGSRSSSSSYGSTSPTSSVVSNSNSEELRIYSNLNPRIQLLQSIIEHVPHTLTRELSDLLWTTLFATYRLSHRSKSVAWEMLTRVSTAACQSRRRNLFLERVFNTYLPTIRPKDYTLNVLNLAKEAVMYELTFNPRADAMQVAGGPNDDDGEDDGGQGGQGNPGPIVDFPGLDRIWHLITTAPPRTIECFAIDFVIKLYLDHDLITNAPDGVAQRTHIRLVDHCIEQLTVAAVKVKAFKDAHVQKGSTEADEYYAEKLRFSRHVMFLRQFIQGIRNRPEYSPSRFAPPELPGNEDTPIGHIITVPFQAYGGPVQHKGAQVIHISENCTAAELVGKLKKATGFTGFSAIYRGQKTDFGACPDVAVRDLGLDRGGLMLIRKDADAEAHPVDMPPDPVSLEVLAHFETLYRLLHMHGEIARETYELLMIFPPHANVCRLVRSHDTPGEEVLPLDKPYVAIYSITALQHSLDLEGRGGDPDMQFVAHAIGLLVTFLSSWENHEKAIMSDLFAQQLTNALIGCLSLALTLYSSPTDEPKPQIKLPEDRAPYMDRLIGLMLLQDNVTDILPGRMPPLVLAKVNAIAVLIKSVQQGLFKPDEACGDARHKDVLFRMFLGESRLEIRQGAARVIEDFCQQFPLPMEFTAEGYRVATAEAAAAGAPQSVAGLILKSLWMIVCGLLPETLDVPRTCKEFFDAAMSLLRSFVILYPADIDLAALLQHCGRLLLQREPQEFVGRDAPDYVVMGFARLMKMCLEFNASPQVMKGTRELMKSIFQTFLIPPLSDFETGRKITPKAPVMNEATRKEVYLFLQALCAHPDNCRFALEELVKDIIPNDLAWEAEDEYSDRTRMIRTPQGYAGLRNLSNTCYLNSLLSQLFMNVELRKFMLDVPIVEDGVTDQTLLIETKKLFAYMQDTWQRSVDPSSLVQCIRTYDNEPIDVNIQMDVDEFYNLLFDRWESQIKDEEHKKAFRAIFGGQLVQQIKSKECEHVSERFEPFSAIQCDIKGKETLQESLRAYVEGEIMQGDNKYSCSSCGRHVDAVKRACLKELPNNLIFHLKRFDFDMITMMRNKINDEFQFPTHIDMSPYKAEHLNNPDKPIEPDMFELVGVLVHSGTAESGHYYSVIKERPIPPDAVCGSWVEFNDADVSRFDPRNIPDQCFGGSRDWSGSGSHPKCYTRLWNGYMLFYERSSSLVQERERNPPVAPNRPLELPIGLELNNHIAMENELFMRTYCLMSPQYHTFIMTLFCLSRRFLDSNKVSPESKDKAAVVRRTAMFAALDTLEQLVVVCSGDNPCLPTYFDELETAICESGENAVAIIEWVRRRENGLSHLLLRAVHDAVRNEFARLLVLCLSKLRDDAQKAPEEDSNRARNIYLLNVVKLVEVLERTWQTLHLNPKAWENYFDLLIDMTTLNEGAVRVILEHGFLQRCLEITLSRCEEAKQLRRQYLPYLRCLEKGRRYPYAKLYELLYVLLCKVNIMFAPCGDGLLRKPRDGKYPLSRHEMELFEMMAPNGEALLARKIIEDHVDSTVVDKIIQMYTAGTDSSKLGEGLLRVLEEGLRLSPASASAPFLDAAKTFCEMSPDLEKIVHIVHFVSNGMDSLQGSGGDEHLSFFRELMTRGNFKNDVGPDWFNKLVIARVHEWLLHLLCYPVKEVRQRAYETADECLFTPGRDTTNATDKQLYRLAGRALCQAGVEVIRSYTSPTDEALVHVDVLMPAVMRCLRLFYDRHDEEDLEFITDVTDLITVIEETGVAPEDEAPSASDLPSGAWEDNSAAGSDSDHAFATSP